MRLLLVLSSLGLVVADESVGFGYEAFQGLTNFYRLHTEHVTWDIAEAACRIEGAHLLVINSEDELTVASLLFGRIPAFVPPMSWGYDLMHVGITDKAAEGEWRTVLGGLLTESGFNKWRNNEPNNYRNNEHCGALDRLGVYSDLQCSNVGHRCPFVCEKENTDADYDAEALPVVTQPNIGASE